MATNHGGIQGDYQDLTFVQEERRLQRKLQYFFKNPCQKWREKRRFPGKLTLQLVKIVLATIQLIFFGFSRSAHVDFIDKTSIAFRHLFLKDWSPSYETMPYPPSSGVYAVYTTDDFFDAVNYAQEQYNMTEQISIGTYYFSMENNTKEPMKMCKQHYKESQIWAYNQSYHFDATVMEECFALHPICDNETHPPTCSYDVKAYLQTINESIVFDRLVQVTLTLKLKTVNLKSLSRFNMPDCFLFIVTIKYDNSHHEGRLTVTLSVEEKVLHCDGSVTFGDDTRSLIVVTMIFDICIILLSVASMVLCCRSLFKSCWLKQETALFFRKFYQRELTVGEQMEFLNLWYILIVINDSMIILGSIFKMEITTKDFTNYNLCGVLLGTGNLLAWFGVLRYLSFFETYNILLLTLKRAAPNMLRFLSCALVFYFGFAVCGWVVLGPYHLKFRSLSTASECLFALVNGDELFITFATINQDGYIWWYSRIYLYCFISLFIYVVLSLFIAIIMETYETIKQSYVNGNPRSELQAFAFRYTPDMSTTVSGSMDDLAYQNVLSATLCVCPPPCFGSCFKHRSRRQFNSLNDDSLDDRSHLISSGEVSS